MLQEKNPGRLNFSPRLLSLNEAAAYLGISRRSVQDYLQNRVLSPVFLPGTGRRGEQRRLRKILIDMRDLDGLIATAKGAL